MSHKHSPAAKYSFKMATSEVASFETNFFWIADTSGDETSMSGKAECLQKRYLFGVTCKCNKLSKIFFAVKFSCTFSRVGLQLYVQIMNYFGILACHDIVIRTRCNCK